jgi:CubicO group peptidase (beta-lactamase class C family)
MIVALASACLLDGTLKHRGTTVPEQLDDGWAVGTPKSVGLDPAVLGDIHDELLRDDAWLGSLGLLVVKDDVLVFETYLSTPDDRDRRHHLWSVTKSVTSLVVGIGRREGWFPELDTPLCTVLGAACDGLEEAKHRVTFAHLLTMRSGIDFPEEDFTVAMLVDDPEDPLRTILEAPMYAGPGEEFLYREADPQLVAYAIRELAGREESSIAAEALFAPLGIDDFHWEALHDGTTLGCFGLFLRPRDVLRLGRLVLEDGRWDDTVVVTPEWLDESTALEVQDAYQGLGYGYYWWLDEGVVAAWGHGGQWIVDVPAEDLLIVHIARPNTDQPTSDVPELPGFLDLVRPLWE